MPAPSETLGSGLMYAQFRYRTSSGRPNSSRWHWSRSIFIR